MSVELTYEKAWWSTVKGLPDLDVSQKDLFHSQTARNFLDRHERLDKMNNYKEIETFFMDRLGYVRAWLEKEKDLLIQGKKSNIRKLLPDILQFVKRNPQIERVLFDYYTTVSPNKSPVYTAYVYTPGHTLLSALGSRLD